ncbi:type IV secretion protein Rhs [Craterilacuibacter sinensis]|uniref:Type IV secretion protein Rhs n=1 Tax=Craterilacuibacter sinensis TaxID=2686017 RepID=A0A845BSB0_9NEIS|nr:type IV secretion protein Rhs [Craterilacuibacter sinensis]MXR35473.1 type IV secretion protein Rhs [Craterilacuibacter sinensis]
MHDRAYLPWLGPRAMAPNGSLYFPGRGGLYADDFSQASPRLQLLFVHEMTHVWQYQRGYRLRLAALCLLAQGGYGWRDAYAYPQQPGAEFKDFNFEQQAELVSHYYGAAVLGLPALQPSLPWLQAVLQGFLADPGDKRLLPVSRRLAT